MWRSCCTLLTTTTAILAASLGVVTPVAAQLPLEEIVTQVFVLSDLKGYLLWGRVAEEIRGEGPYTLLAPWNYGFDKLDDDWVARFRSTRWRAHLQNVLHYHMADQAYPHDFVGDTQTMTMNNGQDVVMSRLPQNNHSRLDVNGVQVVAPVVASNGMVYIIGDVLLPSWLEKDLLDVATTRFSKMASLIAQVVEEATFTDPKAELTVFAPNDAAFAALSPAVTSDPVVLRDVLLYHVAPGGPLPSVMFSTLSTATTTTAFTTLLADEKLNLAVATDGSVSLEGGGVGETALLLETDIVAKNGILHEIDTVLLPYPVVEDESPSNASFTTTVQVSDEVQADFRVLPREGAVEITVTVPGTRWVGVGPNPDGVMLGTTACLAKGDGDPPRLYDIAARRVSGITPVGDRRPPGGQFHPRRHRIRLGVQGTDGSDGGLCLFLDGTHHLCGGLGRG